MDNLVWNVLSSIKSWPTFDLFSTNTGIDENDILTDIILFPNPVSDILYLSYINSEYPKDILTEVYNSIGQKILCSTFKTSGTIQLDISPLVDGIYFVHIRSGKQMSIIKEFIVQHK